MKFVSLGQLRADGVQAANPHVNVAPRSVALHYIVRVGFILAIAGAALIMGYLVAWGRIPETLLLVGLLLPIALVVWQRGSNHVQYGILAILVSGSMLNIIWLPTGTESRIVLSLVIALGLVAFWLLRMLIVEKRIAFKRSPVNAPVFAFVAVLIFAYAWSTVFRDPLVWVWGSFAVTQAASLLVMVLLPILILLVVNQVRDLRYLQLMTWITVGIGAVVLVSELLELPLNVLYYNGARGLFTIWVGILAFAQMVFNQSLSYRLRALLLLILAALIYRNLILNNSWLSGWVPLLAALGVLILLRSRKVAFAAILCLLLAVAWNFETLYQEIVVSEIEEGGLERLDIWRMNLHHVGNHPWFGMGPAGYAVYNMTYHPMDARSTHNNYFDIVAQAGIFGLATFFWLMATLGYIGWRTYRRLAGRGDFQEAFAVASLSGVVAALVSMFLGDWVLPFAYNQTISGFDNAAFTWILWGGMVSLYHMTGSPTAQATPATSHSKDTQSE